MSEGLAIAVQFQNGTRTVYAIDGSERASALIDQIVGDPQSPFFQDSGFRLLYLGRIVSPAQSLGGLSQVRAFTVQCFPGAQRRESHGDDHEILKGFDRLHRAGYSASEIEDIRTAFHAIARSRGATRDQQLDLEDEWVPALALEASPGAALRTIQLMNEYSGPAPGAVVQALDMPGASDPEAESPLLRQEEEEAGECQSWAPFWLGVACGLAVGAPAAFGIPFLGCLHNAFAVGMAFGIALRTVWTV